MNNKILLLAITAVVMGSCSTAYKSGQTPDDVYYSPVRYIEAESKNDRDEVKNNTREDYDIRMCTRDRRWRDFTNDYEYRKSPYYYSTCNCTNYGYYYNPSYHSWPVYTVKAPVNTTPRMVNLNAYKGFNNQVASDPKTGNGINWVKPSATYNNSNQSNIRREKITPSNNSNRQSSSNETRTYTPPSNNSGSGTSPSGNNNSGNVTRPNRGG